MGDLGNLIVSIEVAADKLTSGLNDAANKLQEWSNNANKILQDHYKQFLAIGAAIDAIYIGMAKSGIDYVETLDKMSKTANITTEELSRLGYAAEQEHSSFEALQRTIPILAKNMESAKNGTGQFRLDFEKMGISVIDGNGNLKSTGEILLEISDYFHNATDKTEALAMVMMVLGRGARDLAPLLASGRDRIKELGDEAQRLGIVIDADTTKKFHDMTNAFNSFMQGLKGIGVEIVSIFMPALQKFGDALKNMIIWFHTLTPAMQEWIIIIPLIVGALFSLAGILGFLQAVIFPGIVAGLQLIGATLAWLIMNPIGIAITAIALLATAWINNWGNIQEAVKRDAQIIGNAFDWITERFTKMVLTLQNLANMSWGEKLLHPIQSLKTAMAEADVQYNAMNASGHVTHFGEDFAKGMQVAIDKTKELQKALSGLTAAPAAGAPTGTSATSVMSGLTNFANQLKSQFDIAVRGINDGIDRIKSKVTDLHAVAQDFIVNFHQGLSDAITAGIMGTESWSEAFQKLGQQMLSAIVNFFVQWIIYQAIAKGLALVMQASTVAMAAAIAAAWAPAAALASLATLGSNAVPADAALTSTTALAQFLAIPKAAKGMIVDRPTILLAGEAGREAVVPLENGRSYPGNNISIYMNNIKISSDLDIGHVAEKLGNDINQKLKRVST